MTTNDKITVPVEAAEEIKIPTRTVDKAHLMGPLKQVDVPEFDNAVEEYLVKLTNMVLTEEEVNTLLTSFRSKKRREIKLRYKRPVEIRTNYLITKHKTQITNPSGAAAKLRARYSNMK
jgi:hypothetical protein